MSESYSRRELEGGVRFGTQTDILSKELGDSVTDLERACFALEDFDVVVPYSDSDVELSNRILAEKYFR